MTDPLDASVTVREIAQDYGLSTDAVYQAIRRERLPARRSGATWLINRRDAEALWGTESNKTTESKQGTPVHIGARSIQEFEDSEKRRNYLINNRFAEDTYIISSATIRGEQFHITVPKKKGINLDIQNILLIIDTFEWVLKGVFKIIEIAQTEYRAVAVRDVDPVWKGFVKQEGETSVPNYMTALAVPGDRI